MPVYWKRLLKIIDNSKKPEPMVTEIRRPRKNEKCSYEILSDGKQIAIFDTIEECDNYMLNSKTKGRIEFRRVTKNG